MSRFRATQGGRSNDKNLPTEPADHALGRSRGGLSTKIHTLTDQSTCPVQVRLTGGQAGDNPQLVPLLDDYARPGSGGRFRLLADKAYSHPSTRAALRRRRIGHTIPEKSDQVARRKAKGRAGGRPPAFDASAYKKRNVVERGYLHLKQWRGIATRYDNHARTFLGGVQLASTILHLKHHLGDTLYELTSAPPSPGCSETQTGPGGRAHVGVVQEPTRVTNLRGTSPRR